VFRDGDRLRNNMKKVSGGVLRKIYAEKWSEYEERVRKGSDVQDKHKGQQVNERERQQQEIPFGTGTVFGTEHHKREEDRRG